MVFISKMKQAQKLFTYPKLLNLPSRGFTLLHRHINRFFLTSMMIAPLLTAAGSIIFHSLSIDKNDA
jgi:hypothetical protein